MSTERFIVAGPLDQATGGYQYDKRIVEGLRSLGRCVEVSELAGSFPEADDRAAEALDAALAAAETDQAIIIDGLVLGSQPNVVAKHAYRLRIVALVHHALADEHEPDSPQYAQFLESERKALAHAQCVVTTSHYTSRRLSALGVTAREPAVIEPGVARRQPACPTFATPFNLSCVASLIPRKNHLGLLSALSQISDLDWTCDLIGAIDRCPSTTAAVQQRIKALGLEERVRLTGPLASDALDAAYRHSDLFVLASRFEGYGMVITEALSYGLPIVTTRGGALSDTLPAGTGLSVEPGNTTAFANCLRRAMSDHAVFDALAAGAANARDYLNDWKSSIDAFNELLKDLS